MSVNFILSAFERTLTLDESAEIPFYAPTIDRDASISLTVSVPENIVQQAFYYRTDSLITGDQSYIHFYVDESKWPLLSTTINPKNGKVTVNAHSAGNNDDIGKDFLRELALQLFGTTLGVDLFTNEDEVVIDINNKCDIVASQISTLIDSIDKVNGSIPYLIVDPVNGEKYLDDSDTNPHNISRELFNQLTTFAPTRFADVKTNWLYNNSTDDGYYKMPILAGDKINYQVKVTPSLGQRSAVQTSTNALNPRTYNVELLVGAASTPNTIIMYNDVTIREAVLAWLNLSTKPPNTDPTHIRNWNTQNVTDMAGLFLGNVNFNDDISLWDTSNVITMDGMFSGATAFNQNIGGWNTSNVQFMLTMFADATAFNQYIGGWNTSKVTNMGSMFTGAIAFNQNIGGWDTSNVTETRGMFGGAIAFNYNIGSWNVSKVTDMDYMFYGATTFNQNIGEWNTSSAVIMSSMFNGATAFNQNIGRWDVSSLYPPGTELMGPPDYTATTDMFLNASALKATYASLPDTPTSAIFSEYFI